jgi:hypothetical protein
MLSKFISFLLVAMSLCFLLVNAVLILKEGNYDYNNTFILGITGILFGALFYKKE